MKIYCHTTVTGVALLIAVVTAGPLLKSARAEGLPDAGAPVLDEVKRDGARNGPTGVIRLCGAVYKDGKLDEMLTDFLIVELSREGQAELLDRRDMQLILGELSLSGVVDDAYRQVRLGNLLGVDVFIWVRIRGRNAVLEVVEAATGRGIATHQEKIDPRNAKAAVESLGRQALRAARQSPPKADKDTPTFAIAKPLYPTDNKKLLSETESVLLALAEDLRKSGAQELHRRFIKDMLIERWMMDKGLTHSQRQELPMLGARYILAARVENDGGDLTLILLETQTARRIAHRSWPLKDAGKPSARAAIADWAVKRIAPKKHTAQHRRSPEPKASDSSLQPETLAPFYRGVLLHNQGRYLDGATGFREAMHYDKRFLQPYCWLQSAFIGAGFDEVAQAFAEYVEKAGKDRWKGISDPKALNAEPGTALIGLTRDAGLPESLRVSVMMLLIDGLNQATAAPAFVTADMAQLRDEYDALVGLDKVMGTTWRRAPAMLFAETLTAHLEARGKELRLRLCLVHMLDPNQISTTEIDLETDRRNWPGQIVAGCRKLLDVSSASRPAWKRPPPVRLGGGHVPEELTDREYTPLRYLQCLVGNPGYIDHLSYPHSGWFENVIVRGLHPWFIRTLDDNNPVKPAIEFAYASFYVPRPRQTTHLRQIAKKYPSHPVSLIARLNIVLYEVDLRNLRKTEAELNELLDKLAPHVPGVLSASDLQRYRDTDKLLRRALDIPGGGMGKLEPAGPAWVMLSRGTPARRRAGSARFPGSLTYPGQVTERHKALVDLAVLKCRWLELGNIPVPVIQELYERFADEPDALAYFTVTHANKIFSNRSGGISPDDKRTLAELYPKHARIAIELLKQRPLPFDRQNVCFLVQVHPYIERAGETNPAFRTARSQVKQAVFDAIDDGCFGDLIPMDVFALLCGIAKRGDPQVQPYLRKFVDRAIAGDPLKDRFWRAYVHWDPWTYQLKPKEKVDIYLPLYRRVRELYPEPPTDRATSWFYFDFGVVFFRGGRFDLAEEALMVVVSKDHPKEAGLKANSYYLLALIRQRQRNIPEALRLAKQASEHIGQHRVSLVHSIGIGGSRGGTGSTSNLNSLVMDLIATLRNNPNAAFKSPYGDRTDSIIPSISPS